MSNNSKSQSKNKEKVHHTANFLVSFFLLSKRSLKKIYKLNPSAIVVLRYICDSIDLNYDKTKSFQTHLTQNQIATYCRCSLRTVSSHVQLLKRKRLLHFNEETLIYQIGRTLFAYANIAYPLDVRKKRQEVRSTQYLRTSNSSNLSKSGYASIESQSNSYKSKKQTYKEQKASKYVEEFMNKKGLNLND